MSRGARAATRFSQQLSSLPDGWHFLRTIPISHHGGEIDHLVIGPGGRRFAVSAICSGTSLDG
ncbi:MAG TPA: nuclease-related domain-containing protein [Ilumatobacteraceae bacterium]|nr:nuclease-related domain-containing protein [Ilumatobacteraceae bacterium]